jgi:hypothetical protein
MVNGRGEAADMQLLHQKDAAASPGICRILDQSRAAVGQALQAYLGPALLGLTPLVHS